MQTKEFQGKDTVVMGSGHSCNAFFSLQDTVVMPFSRNIFSRKERAFLEGKALSSFKKKIKKEKKE